MSFVVTAALAAAMMRDVHLQGCVRDAGVPPATYIGQSFTLSEFTLRTGERMTMAIAHVWCMEQGQTPRALVYLKTPHGYRQVLDNFSVQDDVKPQADGTLVLLTQGDSIETVMESAFVWDGDSYQFSKTRSTVWHMHLEVRKPFDIPIAFAPGTDSTVLRGTFAGHFGQLYTFDARAGQRVEIEFLNGSSPHAGADLNYGDDKDEVVYTGKPWSGTLPYTGEYLFLVTGNYRSNPDKLEPYAVRLSIR